MLKRPKWMTCFVLVALLSMLGAFAAERHATAPRHAGTVQHEGRDPSEWAVKTVQEYLGLSDEQVQKWREIQNSHRIQMEEQFKEIRDLEGQLRDALESDNPSSNVVGDLMIRLEKERRQRADVAKSQAEQLKTILNSEQAAKLQAIEESWKSQGVINALALTGFIPPPPPPPLPPVPPHAPEVPEPPPPPPPARY